MNYDKILQGILDIGEELLKSGAENFRLEDSIYRMCRSYGFVRCDVFAITSNIQATVETPDGRIITQIRQIETTNIDFDRLDHLNNLSRVICETTPDVNELQEKFKEIMNRKPQHPALQYLAGVMGGTGFAVFFGGGLMDAIVAVFVSLMIIGVGNWLSKRENNLMVYNLILAFLANVIILTAENCGIGEHPDRTMIGIVMLLISGLGISNGIREFLQRDFISGALNIMNSILGALGIASGIAIPIIMFHGVHADGFIMAHGIAVQLITCTVGCTGFAIMFKARGAKILYSGIGAFFTWGIYSAIYAWEPNSFFAALIASVFVGFYAFFMSRINKAPSTIFLTASVLPLIPGSNLYYMMYGALTHDIPWAIRETTVLFSTCLAIAFGFMIVDVITRVIMYGMKTEYNINKSSAPQKKSAKKG